MAARTAALWPTSKASVDPPDDQDHRRRDDDHPPQPVEEQRTDRRRVGHDLDPELPHHRDAGAGEHAGQGAVAVDPGVASASRVSGAKLAPSPDQAKSTNQKTTLSPRRAMSTPSTPTTATVTRAEHQAAPVVARLAEGLLDDVVGDRRCRHQQLRRHRRQDRPRSPPPAATRRSPGG